MSGRIRLFVAAYPTADAAEALLEALRRLHLPPHREVPPSQVHMTLQFVGDRSSREVDEITESVDRSCRGIGPFALRATSLITLPERGTPRLVAAQTDAPSGLLEVHRRLAQRLAKEPRRDAADHFRPHLTLCRFVHGERPERIAAPLDVEAFAVRRVVLVRSVLKPGGAEHAELAAFELDA